MTAAFFVNPEQFWIKKISTANNADLFRAIGGRFATKRTPDNNLVHFKVDPIVQSHRFLIKGMAEPIVGAGIITGSRPWGDTAFGPVNFNDFEILWNIVFLTHSGGYHVHVPQHLSLE